MPVSIKGTGGGSVTLSAAAAAADTTLTLPNTTGTVINTAPGTSGNVLTSNGTAWVSSAASGGGQLQSVVFTSSTTWTCPAGVTKVYAVCVGGGGASATNVLSCGPTGYGGYAGVAAASITVVPGTVYTLTVGLGAAGVNTTTSATAGSGGTTSFGSLVTATGGAGGSVTAAVGTTGAAGTGSTTGTAIRLANAIIIAASGPLGGNPYYGSTLTAQTWSTSSLVGAGASGGGNGGTAANGSYSGAIYIQYVG